VKLQLVQIAHARSGDKADRADIGLFAWDEAGYRVLSEFVTAAAVAEHFAHHLGTDDAGRVQRFDLPNILALKFVLNGALSGGAANSLRSDNLGKTIGAQLLRMRIEVPDALASAALKGAALAIEKF
jgi:hypothetical protein